jgi:quinoprotein glucose dehydrogenase
MSRKYNEAEMRKLIREGVGRMPGFPALSDEALQAVSRYLLTGEDVKIAPEKAGSATIELKYAIDGYNRFFDPDGYPAVAPPWGTLNAIDLNKGEIAWQVPLGEHPELAAKGMRDTGSWNYGGPIVTAGGVIFIGATNYDKKFRAFEKLRARCCGRHCCPPPGMRLPRLIRSAEGSS